MVCGEQSSPGSWQGAFRLGEVRVWHRENPRGDVHKCRPGPAEAEVQVYPTLSPSNVAAEGGQVEKRHGGVHLYLRRARSEEVPLLSGPSGAKPLQPKPP